MTESEGLAVPIEEESDMASNFRPTSMRRLLAIVLFAGVAAGWAHAGEINSVDAVLDRYKQALGGVSAIAKVQSITMRGEIDGAGMTAKARFVYLAKPFKTLIKITRTDGTEVSAGFDGTVSWTVDPKGASIDKDTAPNAVRRDADLQYALHQPTYFKKLEFAGVTDFEGHPCYRLHGTTKWGKDNNQFYNVQTGLLEGYRFQVDNSSGAVATVQFQDYKSFGGPLVATKVTSRSGDHWRTFTYASVSYAPVADSVFDLPQAVKALL
jgi:hypothetical protein